MDDFTFKYFRMYFLSIYVYNLFKKKNERIMSISLIVKFSILCRKSRKNCDLIDDMTMSTHNNKLDISTDSSVGTFTYSEKL